MDYITDNIRVKIFTIDGMVISGLLNINGYAKLSCFIEEDVPPYLKLTKGTWSYKTSMGDYNDFSFMMVNKRNISVIL